MSAASPAAASDDEDFADFARRRPPKRKRPADADGAAHVTPTAPTVAPSEKENERPSRIRGSDPEPSCNARQCWEGDAIDIPACESTIEPRVMVRRFECVVCCADLEGLDRVARIRHILDCRARAAAPRPRAELGAGRVTSSSTLQTMVTVPPRAIVAHQTPALDAAKPTPVGGLASLQTPSSSVSAAAAAATSTAIKQLPKPLAASEQTPSLAGRTAPASLPPSLQTLMASARRVWGRPDAAQMGATVLPPPPPPRDAFAALMQAAAIAPAGDAPSRGAGAGSRGGGGGGGGGAFRRGGFGGGGGGGRGGGGRARSLLPFKRIEGTRYVVDGFTCGARDGDVHILTHFHADHYIGLNKRWPTHVYASPITAALVARRLGVERSKLIEMPMDEPTTLPGGARVTLIDANHCPGAVLLLMQLPDGRCVLHTGDFRYDPASMLRHPAIAALPSGGLHALYLDTVWATRPSAQTTRVAPRHPTPRAPATHPPRASTTHPSRAHHSHPDSTRPLASTSRFPPPLSTPRPLPTNRLVQTYLDPKYAFPTQAAAVRHVVDTCRLLLPAERTLVLFGTYSIGKERVFMQAITSPTHPHPHPHPHPTPTPAPTKTRLHVPPPRAPAHAGGA